MENNAPARLAHVSKRFGERLALDNFDLSVRAGETLALLGPNGAGKTTAIRILLGLCRPTSGSASIFGAPPQSLAARRRIGAMLQVSGVPPTLTVRELVESFSSYYPHPLPIARTIALANLLGYETRRSGDLSGGERQRLFFALAICGNPDLLFLDEPTLGLDVETRQSLWSSVRELVGNGKSVLLTTHYLDEADALADRVALIARGTLLELATPAELKARATALLDAPTTTLERAYLTLTKSGSPGVYAPTSEVA